MWTLRICLEDVTPSVHDFLKGSEMQGGVPIIHNGQWVPWQEMGRGISQEGILNVTDSESGGAVQPSKCMTTIC